MGGAWFLYVLSVFSLLTGLVYLGLEAGLTLLTDDHSYSAQCAVGFSGIIHVRKNTPVPVLYSKVCCSTTC